MYYVSVNYELGRGLKPSVIAIASLCYVVQASEQYHSLEIRDTILEGLNGFQEKKDLLTQAEALIHVFHSENTLY